MGVYYRVKQDGDTTYYFTYRDVNKTVFQKVGTKTEGVTEQYVFQKRNETIIELRNGEIPQIQRNSKKHEVKFRVLADFYFDNRKVRSIERRRKLYQCRLEDEFGNMNIYKITPKHILDFRNRYVDTLKPHTISLDGGVFSHMKNIISLHSALTKNMKLILVDYYLLKCNK